MFRLLVPSVALVLMTAAGAARAASQWTRKYAVPCTTCHTAAFPRLSYTGEKFMLNGYQDVGSQDGDTAGKQAIGERTFIDEVGNFFGVRLNVVPLTVVTNDQVTASGETTTRVDIGNANWLQLFTAGSLFKNVSIFIETEVPFDGRVHSSWFRLGLHNLLGQKALNVWAGVMDPLELHAASGRLPMIPTTRQDVFYVKSSGGAGDESLNLREGRPAVAVFGTAGPLGYEVGVDNGPTLKDTNVAKNVWATLRAWVPQGPLEGSSGSLWGYWGTDSRVLKDASGARIGQSLNEFWRASGAINLRWRRLDVLAAYVFGRDGSWSLDPDSPRSVSFQGVMAQAGHGVGEAFYVAAQFDRVFSADEPGLELQKIALALSWAPRENWRVLLVPRADILPISATHPLPKHELTLAIRTMF